MPYQAPVSDIMFTLKTIAGLDGAGPDGGTGGPAAADVFGDLTDDLVGAILEEAGKFAGEAIAPLNRVGDTRGTAFEAGAVTTPPGWKETYRAWAAAGWNGLAAPPEWGGQGLPHLLGVACFEMWNAASMAFGVGPMLTMSAVVALAAHGSEALRATFLPKLVSGEWMGTMLLTEPQAGSDVGALRTKAVPAGDGTYRLTGEKIFITYGEHDLTDNIVHLVLARLPDAPPGPKGISLFVVPKVLVNPDGSLGGRNDIKAHSVEHKFGLHGSPTCTMVLGDAGGAVGFLVGQENRGMACMFTMMNEARLHVGVQGVAAAEATTQLAVAYAQERRQGRRPGMPADQSAPIVAFPDVRRMLLRMKSHTKAARAICYATAAALDRAERASDPAVREAAAQRAALLTPVAKAFSTDIGAEVAAMAMQVHGGMGYIEETGVAQFYRDVRVTQIYEGTNGIQAIDLVTRKLPLADGAVLESFVDELRRTVAAVEGANDPAFGATGRRLAAAIDSLAAASRWLIGRLATEPDAALAGATPYLRLFGIAAGGCFLAEEALAAAHQPDAPGADTRARIALVRFFAESVAVEAEGLELAIVEGADSVLAAEPVFAS